MASKLGLDEFDDKLFTELINLMIETKVDYTIFFRELSNLPSSIEELEKSFYSNSFENENLKSRWSTWLKKWKKEIEKESKEELSRKMKLVNPKYTLREWHLVPAYQEAQNGNYKLVRELQEVMTNPYDEQSKEIEVKYYAKNHQIILDLPGYLMLVVLHRQ